MADYLEELYYTNNSIGDAVGDSYNTTVSIIKFRDFLNEMIEKGADTLSIWSYQRGEYQRMKITRERTKEERIKLELEEVKKDFEKKLKTIEAYINTKEQ